MEARAIEVVADSEAATLPVSRPRFRRFLPVGRFRGDRWRYRGYHVSGAPIGRLSLPASFTPQSTSPPKRRAMFGFWSGSQIRSQPGSHGRHLRFFGDDAT